MAKTDTTNNLYTSEHGDTGSPGWKPPTEDQSLIAMEVIGRKARAAQRLCYQLLPGLTASSEVDDAEALWISLEAFVTQIGWTADKHSTEGVPESGEEWLLPPVWHPESLS